MLQLPSFTFDWNLIFELLCGLGALEIKNSASPLYLSIFYSTLAHFDFLQAGSKYQSIIQFVWLACSLLPHARVQSIQSTANLRGLLLLIWFKCEVLNPFSCVFFLPAFPCLSTKPHIFSFWHSFGSCDIFLLVWKEYHYVSVCVWTSCPAQQMLLCHCEAVQAPASQSSFTKAPAWVLGDLLLLSPDPLELPHAAKAILHYEW